MSQDNVDIVRRHFAVWQRAFELYWENPLSTAAALDRGEISPEYLQRSEALEAVGLGQ